VKNKYKKIIEKFLLGDYFGYEEMINSGMYAHKKNDLEKLIGLSWLNCGEKLSDKEYNSIKIKTLKSIDENIINLLK
jgi:hypothetical protein